MTYSNIEVMSNFTTSWVSLQEKLKEIIQAEREIPGTPQTTQKNKTTAIIT